MSFFVSVLNDHPKQQSEHGEVIRAVLANPTYRSIKRLSTRIDQGDWYKQAIRNYLLKRLIQSAIHLDDTISYYKQVTWSHWLLIIWRRLTWGNVKKIPICGLSILYDTGKVVEECEERRDALAVSIGQVYGGNVSDCLKGFGVDLHEDMLESTSMLPLDQYSRLHRPGFMTKYWIAVLGGPLVALLFHRMVSRLDVSVMVDSLLQTIDIFNSYCQSWIIDPLFSIINTVRYPHDRPLVIITESALLTDRATLSSMIESFAKDTGITVPPGNLQSGDLSPILQHYQEEIRRPIASALTGSLLRLLLIQLQKGKIDVQSALLAVDRLLRANELNFALLTVLPAGYLLVFALRATIGLLIGNGDRLHKKAILKHLQEIERLCNVAEGSEKECGLLLILVYRLCACQKGLVACEPLVELLDPRLTGEQRRWTAFRMRSYYLL